MSHKWFIIYWFCIFFMYLISFHLVMNSDDWFLMWMGLEINMLMFIVIIFNRFDMGSSESCLKYFFIQSLGSGIFMSSLYMKVYNIKMIVSLVMSYKIGAGPFFFWFPSICGVISWFSFFILLTFQSIIPLFLMNIFMSDVVFLIIIISLLVGVFGSFSQVNLKQLLAYSSIFHLGWILLCNMSEDFVWMDYLLMYMFMLFPLIYFLKNNNMLLLSEISKLKYKWFFLLMMLSMGGMPPFLGFFLKWFALKMMFNLSFYMFIILMLCSVIMFYVYFRLLYDMLLYKFKGGEWISWDCKNFKSYYLMDMMNSFGFFMSSVMVMFIYL